MTELDIGNMTIQQTRAAAQELLDSTTGDLAGADAERFQALNTHAQTLREREQQRVTASRDMLARLASGELRAFPGSPQGEPASSRDDWPVGVAMQQRDNALRVLERHVTAGRLLAAGAEVVEHLVDSGPTRSRSWASRWAVEAGSEDYRSAFAKRLIDPDHGHLQWTEPEAAAWRTVSALQSERAMSLTDSAGGFLAPLEVDPTLRLSNSGSNVPILQIANVIQTVSDVWSGVTSAGVSAEWLAEASEAADASPTLAAPSIPAYKMSCFTPYSVELEGDAASLLQQLGTVLFDGAEQLLSTALTTGTGSGQPTGIISALVASSPTVIVTGDGSEALAASDFYKLQNALGPRWQQNARFMASLPVINTARQFETGSGALKFPSLQSETPSLLGRPIHENSRMDSALNAAASEANYLVVYGDFKQYVCTMRVGAQIELVPHIFGSSRRPTGQRGAWLWGRYGADSIIDSAFTLLNVPTTA